MSNPVVCRSGAGNLTLNNFNLVTGCGAPAGQSIYVVLRVRADQASISNPTPKGVATLNEGALTCTVTANTGEYADCVITVNDGILDQMISWAVPQNYSLTASWADDTTADPVAGDAYSFTLESGKQLDVYSAATFGEIITSGLLLCLIAVLVLKFCYDVVISK